jgi:hypothetical protein
MRHFDEMSHFLLTNSEQKKGEKLQILPETGRNGQKVIKKRQKATRDVQTFPEQNRQRLKT